MDRCEQSRWYRLLHGVRDQKSDSCAGDDDAEQREGIVGKDGQDGAVELCSFHPSYGYEDFLEGYRPKEKDGQLVFEMREGIFKKLCNRAAEEPSKSFYLLIDEINRGDIPRVFVHSLLEGS